MRKTKLREHRAEQNYSGTSLSTDDGVADGDDDNDYAKQPDNTFKAVCSRMRPLMREFLHTHVTSCTQTLLPTYIAFQRTRIRKQYQDRVSWNWIPNEARE